MAEAPVLELRDVTISARLNGVLVDVLQNISVTLGRGGSLALIGESGAGKSMLGRAILSELPRHFALRRGAILLGGEDLSAMTPAQLREVKGRRIAFVPQDPQSALNPVLSIGAQFDEYLRRLGVVRALRPGRIIEALHSVQLDDPEAVVRKFPHQLSGGMCQRVMIAMAFAAKPELIVADEATSALDTLSQARIVDLLDHLRRRSGTAVIFITHDLRLATHVCDDVLVLYAGQALEYGDSREVASGARHPYTRSLHAANPSLTGPLRRLPQMSDTMPGLFGFGVATGCRYASRCPVASESCANALPAPRRISDRHWVSCAPACQDTVLKLPDLAHAAAGPAGEAPPMVRVEGLNKSYRTRVSGRAHVTNAVSDLSFTLDAGETLGIVGLSGSGKSTLARLLVGMESPDSGVIELAGRNGIGRDAATVAHRVRSIQMIFQNARSALNPRRSVGQLITQPYESPYFDPKGESRAEAARRLIAQVRLPSEVAARFPSQLSGGQRQRVGIGRALCARPAIILADEIVSGLDVSVQAEVLNLLLDLRQDIGMSLIFISHDLAVVRYICDRIVVMRDGVAIEQGKTEALLARPRHAYTRNLLAAVPPENPFAQWRGQAEMTAPSEGAFDPESAQEPLCAE